MKPNYLLLIVLGAVAVGGLLTLNYSQENAGVQSVDKPILLEAFANPNACSMSLDEALTKANAQFKLPKSMPASHSVQDAFGEKGQIALYYALGAICEDDVKYKTFEDGIIKFVAANSESTKSTRITEGVEYFKEYRANAPIPEKIQLFEINGNPAMGWESGTRKSQYIDSDSGTIIHEEDIPHPAQIKIIDTKNKMFYSIKGYLPLEQLKEIMSETLG